MLAYSFTCIYLLVIFLKLIKSNPVHEKLAEVDEDYNITSHLKFKHIQKICSSRDIICKSNNTIVCSMRILDGIVEFKDFVNSCYLFLSNMCDNPGKEYHIASESNCLNHTVKYNRRMAEVAEDYVKISDEVTDSKTGAETDDEVTDEPPDTLHLHFSFHLIKTFNNTDDLQYSRRIAEEAEEKYEKIYDKVTDSKTGTETDDKVTDSKTGTEKDDKLTDSTTGTETDDKLTDSKTGTDTDDKVTDSKTGTETDNKVTDSTTGTDTDDKITDSTIGTETDDEVTESTTGTETEDEVTDIHTSTVDEPAPTIPSALRTGKDTFSTLYDVDTSYDFHICPLSCPDIYSPVCVSVNRGQGIYFKMYTFVNHCLSDIYYCKNWEEFQPPPGEDSEAVRSSPLSWSFCSSSRYTQFARFTEVTSSMGHYGWLAGDYKARHIMEPHERFPGYG